MSITNNFFRKRVFVPAIQTKTWNTHSKGFIAIRTENDFVFGQNETDTETIIIIIVVVFSSKCCL